MILNKKLLIELIVVLILAVVILYAYRSDIRSYQEDLNKCESYLKEYSPNGFDMYSKDFKFPSIKLDEISSLEIKEEK